MTLTNRLLLFLLATLGIVVAGFSASVYLVARAHLQRRSVEHLEAALQTLVAAAEIGSDGVQWEPAERVLTLGAPAGEGIVWRISDENGRTVDRSARPDADAFWAALDRALQRDSSTTGRLEWDGQPWRASQRRLAGVPTGTHTRHRPGEFDALVITAGVPLAPIRATLRTLATVLTVLSLVILLLALVAGRAVCRRALAPVRGMAQAARSMGAEDAGQRLPESATRDEVADLGRAFNGLLDRLQESFERQQRFTGEASHQLRTPLSALLGQVEVALRRERPVEEYRRVLQSMQSEATRLRQIVEALLFLARADKEARQPELQALDLSTWLPRHLETWTHHPRADDLRLGPDPGGPLWIEAQPALLGELLNNLIDNAFKYSRPGSPVAVYLAQSPRVVSLTVADQGCGIAVADRAHLFEPFFRSPEARRLGAPGVGLGLAVAKRLAEALHGTIEATSEPGAGSRFMLRLPEADHPVSVVLDRPEAAPAWQPTA